ncbi:MAG TPA: 2-oxoacid:acceptor oxidoreductase family protein [bacterium]|nr:2-oxoacid:acceptor oxidoreductase family protein [bacterium]
MLVKTIFAGFGGQGVLLMGVCVATAAMNEDKFVTYMPSYGAEVRGGTANCTVSISTDEISSPIASSPNYVVAMNNPSLLRFQHIIKPGGYIVTNSSLVNVELGRSGVTQIQVPGSDIAEELGAMRSANMVMLGAYAAVSNVVSFQSLIDAVGEVTGKKKKELVEFNIKAIKAGHDNAKEQIKKLESIEA